MSTPTPTAPNSRRGLMRWSIAAAATATLVISGSGLVVFAQSGTGEAQGPQFAPADAIAYVEARLDMPAGQEEAVAQMLTAFPGFADPGSFEMKKDELLAMLTAQLGADAIEGDLIGDVLTGEIGLALGDIESAMMGGDPSIVAGMAVADADAARAVLDGLMTRPGMAVTESSYNDVAVYSDPNSSPATSLALHGDWVIMGVGEGAIESAIDVLDGKAPSLAENEDFIAAWSRLPDARLMGAWMDLTPLASLLDMAAMMAEGETGLALPTADIAAMLPVDMTASLVAENDRLTLEALITPGAGTPMMPVGDSDLAMSFPGDTQVYMETRELGAAIESGLEQLVETMEAQALATEDPMGLGDVSEITALLGEDSPFTMMLQGVTLTEFLDFVGDAGVGAGISSDGLWLGIAGEVKDEAVAEMRMANLISLLTGLTLGMEESGISVDSANVEDVEVTTFTVPIDAMLAESGVPMGVGDSIDIALADGKVLIGLGDFVENAIVSDGSDSLGASVGYADALADDTTNSGVFYLNISSLLGELDPMLTAMSPEWAQISPYATGLDRMIVVGTGEDEVIRTRMTVIAGQ